MINKSLNWHEKFEVQEKFRRNIEQIYNCKLFFSEQLKTRLLWPVITSSFNLFIQSDGVLNIDQEWSKNYDHLIHP